ncbi:MAG: hypothetical protein IT376_06290 [Polyangiaceae bacterium]|nr:hypothetical protein [Polyangiaceae bacterium]
MSPHLKLRTFTAAAALAVGGALVALAGGDATAQTLRNPWGTTPSGAALTSGFRGATACGPQLCTQAATAARCTDACWAKACTTNPIVAGQCKPHVKSSFQAQAAQAPATKQLVAPPTFSKAGQRIATKRRMFDRSSMSASGYAGTPAGDQIAGRNAYAPRPTATPARAAAVTAKTLREAVRTGWEGNGDAVASCEEYVCEKFYSYGRFLDDVARAAGDPRQVFTLAYGAQHRLSLHPNVRTRSNAETRDVAGALVPFRLPAGLRPKNDFVGALPAEGLGLPYPYLEPTAVSALNAECKPVVFAEADFGPAGRLA